MRKRRMRSDANCHSCIHTKSERASRHQAINQLGGFLGLRPVELPRIKSWPNLRLCIRLQHRSIHPSLASLASPCSRFSMTCIAQFNLMCWLSQSLFDRTLLPFQQAFISAALEAEEGGYVSAVGETDQNIRDAS